MNVTGHDVHVLRAYCEIQITLRLWFYYLTAFTNETFLPSACRCHRNSLYTVEENTGKGNVHPQLLLKTTVGLFKHVYIHILILLGSFQPENYFSLFLKQALIIMVRDFMTFVTLELGNTHKKKIEWIRRVSVVVIKKQNKKKSLSNNNYYIITLFLDY